LQVAARRCAIERGAVQAAVGDEGDVAAEQRSFALGDAVAQVVADDQSAEDRAAVGADRSDRGLEQLLLLRLLPNIVRRLAAAQRLLERRQLAGQRLAVQHVARAVAGERDARLVDDHRNVGGAALTTRRIGEPGRRRFRRLVGAGAAAVLVETAEDVAHRALAGAHFDERLKLQRRQAERAIEQLTIVCDPAVDVGEQLVPQLPADEHVSEDPKQHDDREVSCDDLQPHGGSSLWNAAGAQYGLCARRSRPTRDTLMRALDIIGASNGSRHCVIAAPVVTRRAAVLRSRGLLREHL
jgi:hypothetical protein